jgi:hypothetical protein
MPLSLLLDEDLRGRALWNAIQRHNVASPHEAIDVILILRKGHDINEVVEYLAMVCHTTWGYEWECQSRFIPL